MNRFFSSPITFEVFLANESFLGPSVLDENHQGADWNTYGPMVVGLRLGCNHQGVGPYDRYKWSL